MTTFKELAIGQTFDCIDDAHPSWTSFSDRCVKVSARKYQSLRTGYRYTIGTVHAKVHHVEEAA